MITSQSNATGSGGDIDLPTGRADSLRMNYQPRSPDEDLQIHAEPRGAKVLITSSNQIAVRKGVVNYRKEGLSD